MPRSFTFRLSQEGVAELEKELVALGDRGAAAMLKLEKAAPGFGAALEESAKRAAVARQKLDDEYKRSQKEIAAVLESGVRNAERSYQELRSSLESTNAAGQRFAKGQATIQEALRRGVIDLPEAKRVHAQLEQQFRSSTTAATGFATGLTSVNRMLGVFGLAVSATAVIGWGKQIAAETGALIDQAKQLQQNVASLQAYRLTWEQNGSSAAEADKAMAAANKTVGEAVDNIGNARRELAEWNIDWRELAAVAPEQRLALIARGILSIEDSGRRARAEMAMFGRNGREFETVLEAIAGGIAGVVEQQEKLGNLQTEEIARRQKAAADSMAQSFRNLRTEAAPSVVAVNEALADLFAWMVRINKQPPPAVQWLNALSILKSGAPSIANPLSFNTNPDGSGKPYVMGSSPRELGSSVSNYSTYLSGLREEAALSTMTAQKRAEVTALIAAANAKLQDGAVHQGKAADFAGRQAKSLEDALKILSPSEAAEVRRAAAAQKTSDSYSRAVKPAKEISEADKAAAEAAEKRKAFLRDILAPLRDETSLVGKTREERERELEILRLKQQYGESAVKLSEEELRNRMRIRDEMAGDDFIADLRDQVKLSGMSREEAEREAAVLSAMRTTRGNLRQDQADEIRMWTDARREAERMVDTAEDVRGVIRNWAEDGKVSLSDLGAVFRRQLADMATQAMMTPLIMPIVGAFQVMSGGGALSSLAMGASAGGGFSPLGMLSNASTTGNMLGLNFGGDMFSGVGSWINNIGGNLGFGSMQAVGLNEVGNLSYALKPGFLGSTTLSQAMTGFGVGSMIGGMMGGNSMVSGALGLGGQLLGSSLSFLGAAGGPIGMLAGGLIGGALGNFGASNQGAIANFTDGGAGSYLFKQGGGNNGQLSLSAAQQVSAVISALKSQGVNIGLGNITGLSIGSDKSYVYDSLGGKQKLGGGDVEGIVAAILARILPSATGGTAEAQTVLSKYMAGGGINSSNLSQLTQDLSFANTLKDLDFSVKQLTQSEQALKAINDQYQQLIDKANELGLSTERIETARATAIQSLIQSFDESVSMAIRQIEDPQAAARAALEAQQAQRIKEATALGADLNEVYRLNALETKNLIDAQNLAAAQNAEQARNAAEAMALQRADFDNQMRLGILGFANTVEAALAIEKDAADKRLEQARQLGANLAQVEEYNAKARQKVIDNFAPDTSGITAARGNLAGLVASLSYGNDSAASPEQQYFGAAANYQAAKNAAMANRDDPLALATFQQAASTFAPIAREFLGSSQAYGRIRDDILGSALNLGGAAADPYGVGAAMVAATTNGTGAIVDTLGETNARLGSLEKQFGGLAALIQTVINRRAA